MDIEIRVVDDLYKLFTAIKPHDRVVNAPALGLPRQALPERPVAGKNQLDLIFIAGSGHSFDQNLVAFFRTVPAGEQHDKPVLQFFWLLCRFRLKNVIHAV